jgi:Leucine-rich repeat (LRR) protein
MTLLPTTLEGTGVPTTGEGTGVPTTTEVTGVPTTEDISTLGPTSSQNDTLVPTGGNITADSPIEEFLLLTLTDDGSLSAEGTPQSAALGALLETSPDLDPTVPEDQVEILQRYALNTLYFATSGESWVNNELWTSPSNPCGGGGDSPWFGVSCDGDSVLVTELSLPGNDLLGSLPSEMRALTGLQGIDFESNQLSGVIPNDIGALTLLTNFNAGTNFFTSSIPPSVGNLTSLENLSLYSNLLSGNIPAEIGQLQALQSLSLESNFLTGNLPIEFFALSSIGKPFSLYFT